MLGSAGRNRLDCVGVLPSHLDAPVEIVAGADVPMPYARNLERLAVPDEAAVEDAVRRTLWREGMPLPRSPVSLEEQHAGDFHAQDGRLDGGRDHRPVAQA